jgi:hypothetical protein
MSDNRLRTAFDSEPVPHDLEARVRAKLEQPAATTPWPRLLSSFALLLALVGGLQVFRVVQTAQLLRVGLEDHLQCAIGGVYPKQTEKAAMTTAMGPYSVMLQPILDQMPGDAVISAHRCTTDGRAYVHVIVRRGSTLISVIMTKRKSAETYPRSIMSRSSVRQNTMEGYSVSGFAAGGYLGYVISGLPPQQNSELAERIAPVVRRYTGA